MCKDSDGDLEKWFRERPLWLQDAARRILQSGEITQKDIGELLDLCKKEGGLTSSTASSVEAILVPEGAFGVRQDEIKLRLDEISDVIGINALAPRNSLKFGSAPLTVVYGSNGSGKSGYVRAMKHACGSRNSGPLHGNVFDSTLDVPTCTFHYTINDSSKPVAWTHADGVVDDLASIEIYDTHCAMVYVDDENEVAYEPWPLPVFSQLANICGKIGDALKLEIRSLSTSKPDLPKQFRQTEMGQWYEALNHKSTLQEIDSNCSWSDTLETALAQIKRRLLEPKPKEKRKELLNRKSWVDDLFGRLANAHRLLSPENSGSYFELKKDAANKRRAADDYSATVFKNAPLTGVGSETWKLLWEQARAYSLEYAYPKAHFPNVSEGSRCVLCQQPLNSEARDRLTSFESFVQGGLEQSAQAAAESLLEREKGLDCVPTTEDLKLRIDSCQISDPQDIGLITAFREALSSRKENLSTCTCDAELSPLPDLAGLGTLTKMSSRLEKESKDYELDAETDNRVSLEERALVYECQKWLCQQKDAVLTELDRLEKQNGLNEALRLVSTQALSLKKSGLAEELISEALRSRFDQELRLLGIRRLSVEVIKTKTQKGHVLHKLRLTKCVKDVCTTEIISEGEFRVISLAAFLADVRGRKDQATLIFDDPISSLDQDFEELVAKRLVELAKDRQVIIFTHRLSLLALLQEDVNVVALRRESWGAGEPTEVRPDFKKPEGVINKMLKERLPQARKALNDLGSEAYERLALGICIDFRITLERLIELDLLADVVQRFRRAINTMGKIHKLARISADDCTLIDDMMTKYSIYLHSQSDETPVSIPLPDELQTDLEKIRDWRQEFVKR